MCGISGVELVVIVAVAIVIMGPERLPEMMRNLGRLMREVRRMTGDLGQVTREIQSSVSMEDMRRQIREELKGERERFRRLAEEVEIDQIKARRPTRPSPAGEPADAPRPAAPPDAADGPPPEVAAPPTALPATAGVDDGLEAPLPPLPPIRRAQRTAARLPDGRPDQASAPPEPGPADAPAGDAP
jgi:sec-independent protein translocase protein TatB